MYSQIPVPHTEWRKEDMKYVFAFFPLVGVIIAGAEYIWFLTGKACGFSSVFKTAVSAVLPLIITGGIHLDGFMDTSDALSSYRSVKERLAILKDPHIGAFAVIKTLILFTIMSGSIYQMFEGKHVEEVLPVFCLIFVFSRIMSAGSVFLIQSAGNQGSLEAMSAASEVKTVKIIIAIEYLITAVIMTAVSFLNGIIVIAVSILVFIFYRKRSINAFGGVTGDTSGWFLCVNECACTMMLAMAAYLY